MNKFELRWLGIDPQIRTLQYRQQTIQMDKDTGKLHAVWDDWREVPTVAEKGI